MAILSWSPAMSFPRAVIILGTLLAFFDTQALKLKP